MQNDLIKRQQIEAYVQNKYKLNKVFKNLSIYNYKIDLSDERNKYLKQLFNLNTALTYKELTLENILNLEKNEIISIFNTYKGKLKYKILLYNFKQDPYIVFVVKLVDDTEIELHLKLSGVYNKTAYKNESIQFKQRVDIIQFKLPL